MSTSLLERPVLRQSPMGNSPLPCEERIELPQEIPANWISRMISKSYINSFNYALTQLGWVPQRILEIGSGDGTLLTYVGQMFMNAELIGIEFDAGKIALAKSKNCCRVRFMELHNEETLPFEANSFDLVISHGFLGSSPIPRYWIKEMARVSAEGLIVSAPTPVGYKWLQKLPGSEDARLLNNPIFSPDIQPIAMRQMDTWMARLGMKTESISTPLPYGMMMARKPQG